MKKLFTNITYLYTISCFITIHCMQQRPLTKQAHLDHLNTQLRHACLEVTAIKNVENLLKQEANPLSKDENGNNCFHLLVQAAGNGELRNTDSYVPFIQLLFKYNTPSKEQVYNDNALMDFLISIGLLNFVYPRDLVKIIAQFANHYPSSQQNALGQTPLHIILGSKAPNINLAKLFIGAGSVCINIRDVQGRLPDQCPRPSLPPQQIQYYDETRAEIEKIITKTRNSK